MAEIPLKSNGQNNWVEYRLVVLHRLEEHSINQEEASEERAEIRATQVQILLDVRELKVRAAIWGGIAGGLVGLLSVALSFALSLLF